MASFYKLCFLLAFVPNAWCSTRPKPSTPVCWYETHYGQRPNPKPWIMCYHVSQNAPLDQLLSNAMEFNTQERKNIHTIAAQFKSLRIESKEIVITQQILREFVNLEDLMLGDFMLDNVTFTIDTNAFEHTSKLKTLEFNNLPLPSNIREALRPLFGNMEDLAFRQIDTKPHLNLLSEFTNLKAVLMKNCFLDEFPTQALQRSAATLTKLDLSRNKLRTIKAEHLSSFRNLEHLTLERNEISAIEPISFQPLTKLKSLDLETNRVANLTADMFRRNTNLEWLRLAGNPTTGLSRNDFSFLTKLIIVTLP